MSGISLKAAKVAEAKEGFRLIRDNFPFFAACNLYIKDKAGRIVSFRLNQPQCHVHAELQGQLEKDGKVRAIILKGRQEGISTYIAGRLYWRTSLNVGRQTFILTHELPATDNLFGMVQRFNDLAVLKPVIGASNAKELVFPNMQSGYKVGTAGSKAVGRSSTIQLFHGSEVAFWPNAEEHLAGVMQAVPDLHGTEVALESTANGVGGVFYDYWQDAKNGKNGYLPVFVPWFWMSDYRRDATGFEPDASEARLASLYGLDNGQLAWRRHKIGELRSEDLFKQEYPCNDIEAFIMSGRRVFAPADLEAARANCFVPTARMALCKGVWQKREDGELRVWFDPEPGRKYVIGGDVAEGLAHGDYSCLDVLELPEGAQVAQWHGHISPDQLANIAKHLALRYNKAFVGIERNNHGLTTLTYLRDSGYSNIYAQRDIESRGGNRKETKKLGWLTTSKSKFKIIDQLQQELNDRSHGIHCKETLDECATMVVEEDGSYNAQAKCHDDRVMARCIAGEMVRAHCSYKGLREAA